MAAARHEVQLMLPQRLDLEVVLAPEDAVLGHEELDLPGTEALRQALPVRRQNPHPRPRIDANETDHRLRDDQLLRVSARAEHDLSCVGDAAAIELAVELLGSVHDLPRALDQQTPLGGRRQARAGAQEQLGTDLLLQRLHAAGERRLRHLQRLRGTADGAVLHDREQVTQRPELEGHAGSIWRSQRGGHRTPHRPAPIPRCPP
jgi:hypothetical protein